MSSYPEQAVAGEITAFELPKGTIQPGNSATASLRVKNTGVEDRTLWIGYSVQDPSRTWHDAPAIPVRLASGEESNTQELYTAPLATSGYYKTRVSVWSEKPEGDRSNEEEDGVGGEAQRLADLQQVSAFRVSSRKEDFASLEESRWTKPAKEIGRSRLHPSNVFVEDGQLHIKIPAGTLDGGEIESKDLYESGFYMARMKVPDAPFCITAFFLYEPPDYESEIDIEIYNDSSPKIMFTTYADGSQSHTETMKLPFDPAKDFHDYAFFYSLGSVTFYVDGEPMKTYEGDLPDKPMKLHLNVWFPTWLAGKKPTSDSFASIDWIEY